MLRAGSRQGRLLVGPLDLLDVEADALHAVLHVERVQFVRVVQGLEGEHRDHVKGNAVTAKPRHPVHHAPVGPAPVPGHPLAVVQKRRPVEADADPNAVPPDEVAPRLVEQGGVGLIGVDERIARAVVARRDGEGLRVERAGHDQRLPRVPDHREAPPDDVALEDTGEEAIEHGETHPLGVLAVGQVAVAAVEVAEGGGLDHEQVERTADPQAPRARPRRSRRESPT